MEVTHREVTPTEPEQDDTTKNKEIKHRDPTKMTIVQLKNYLKKRNQPNGGMKSDLQKQVREYQKTLDECSGEHSEEEISCSMFRPCIDLHEGKVKQIIGSTLTEEGACVTNFESSKCSSYFAALYKKDELKGGHVIMLGPNNEEAAFEALKEYPLGMHVGGGITDQNAQRYLDAGASHVIVTSYVFNEGQINFERLDTLLKLVGKNRLVLDLSCKVGPDGSYCVVTNKWTKFTNFKITKGNLEKLSNYCDEFLVHAVDVEGKQSGILTDLVQLLADYSPIPVTYAGGAKSIQDLETIKAIGKGKISLTIGSALNIFGGKLSYDEVVKWTKQNQ